MINPNVKLKGTTWWLWKEGGQNKLSKTDVSRAIFTSKDRLVFDFNYEGKEYTTELKRINSSEFKGVYTTRRGSDIAGLAKALLYENADGYFLYGEWFQDGYDHIWWIQLKITN